MNFLKKYKGIIIGIVICVVVLAVSFYYPDEQSTNAPAVEPTIEDDFKEILDTVDSEPEATIEPILVKTKEIAKEVEIETNDEPEDSAMPAKEEVTETSTPMPVPVLSPTPAAPTPLETKEPIKVEEEKNTLSCTLTIRCDTILNNMEKVVPEKVQVIPQNGVILPETELEFSEGETVFDVLERELKNKKIHFEFTKVTMYDSAYIEGIGNLYEFDAGNLSGWIYRVNGKVPSVGCSQYKLMEGDKIEILYTCKMGKDL